MECTRKAAAVRKTSTYATPQEKAAPGGAAQRFPMLEGPGVTGKPAGLSAVSHPYLTSAPSLAWPSAGDAGMKCAGAWRLVLLFHNLRWRLLNSFYGIEPVSSTTGTVPPLADSNVLCRPRRCREGRSEQFHAHVTATGGFERCVLCAPATHTHSNPGTLLPVQVHALRVRGNAGGRPSFKRRQQRFADRFPAPPLEKGHACPLPIEYDGREVGAIGQATG
jgi:hypothetical protein